ncbi:MULTISPECIES: ANTAR domain-containing response regulator [Shewanella]|uniref:ANTAR domain-containing protein n=1 Tax=Shewanella electrodiphila TaxID=934143 RepID=A0ABT0KN39_9GAMM|nr:MULTISPECIES: ANTAR domain-containing protein [Shewanella]MCC4831435.1 ANTAR domain-containing protein [Shewanella sp. 10N.7]MCL1045273.1 ANTAR domain-containing protein [Shewanella electrodiphila]
MVNLVYRDPSFKNEDLFIDCMSELSSEEPCIEMTSLSQLERQALKGNGLCLVFFTEALQPLQQVFIERLLASTALPIIVNAYSWDETHLENLLKCGRVTFVPEKMTPKRLNSLVGLAKIRFNSASNMLEKVKLLDAQCTGLKQLSKAKSLLQTQGLSESQAHELIQKQAMSKSISLADMAQQVIIAAQQLEAKKMHQFGANAPAVNKEA